MNTRIMTKKEIIDWSEMVDLVDEDTEIDECGNRVGNMVFQSKDGKFWEAEIMNDFFAERFKHHKIIRGEYEIVQVKPVEVTIIEYVPVDD